MNYWINRAARRVDMMSANNLLITSWLLSIRAHITGGESQELSHIEILLSTPLLLHFTMEYQVLRALLLSKIERQELLKLLEYKIIWITSEATLTILTCHRTSRSKNWNLALKNWFFLTRIGCRLFRTLLMIFPCFMSGCVTFQQKTCSELELHSKRSYSL